MARDMIVQLGALLRTLVQRSRDQLFSVRKELDVVDRYLSIQRMRFGDRLIVDIRVDDAVLDAVVPTMLIQPLVENAIRHAVEVAGQGTVLIAAGRFELGAPGTDYWFNTIGEFEARRAGPRYRVSRGPASRRSTLER